MRRLPAVLATAALVALALTGCSAAGASNCVQPGDASKLVKVSGKFGSPDVSFPKPLHSQSLQKSTVKQGTGEALTTGQYTVLSLAFYDGITGTSVQDPGTVALVAGSTQSYPGLQRALLCTTVGSRIAITGTVKQIFGSDAQTSLPSNRTLVFAFDVKRAYLARANGAPQPAQPGMPSVVLAPNGRPGITIPSHDAPTALRTAVLKQGSGAVIKKDKAVLVNYTSVAWNNPDTVASSSWTTGTPVVWPDTSGSGYNPPASVLKQLVGQRIGTQLLVVTPSSGSESATAFVIDILGSGA